MPKPKLPAAFVAYCWGFYGPNEIYGHFFDHKLTKAELIAACRLRVLTVPEFVGDTVDREAVRELILFARKHATGAGLDGMQNLFARLAKTETAKA